MSDYTVVDASDVEAMRGAFRKMRIALGDFLDEFGFDHGIIPPSLWICSTFPE